MAWEPSPGDLQLTGQEGSWLWKNSCQRKEGSDSVNRQRTEAQQSVAEAQALLALPEMLSTGFKKSRGINRSRSGNRKRTCAARTRWEMLPRISQKISANPNRNHNELDITSWKRAGKGVSDRCTNLS